MDAFEFFTVDDFDPGWLEPIPECGDDVCQAIYVSEVYKQHLEKHDDLNIMPYKRFYYDLRKAWKIHKSQCDVRKVHSATGKTSPHVIACSLIHAHRSKIDDAEQVVEKVITLMREDREQYEAKKASAVRTKKLTTCDRDMKVLMYNLKRT